MLFYFLITIQLTRKPEITKLKSSFLYQHIRRLYVPMHYFQTWEVLTSYTNLIGSLSPIETLIFSQDLLKRTPLAVFQDDITIFSSEIKVPELQDVWMLHRFQNFYLVIQQFTMMRFHIDQRNSLNRYLLILIIIFVSLVNSTAETTTDLIIKTITVSPNSFFRKPRRCNTDPLCRLLKVQRWVCV